MNDEAAFVDGILVFGKTRAEHDTVRAVLKTAIESDPAQVTAIKEMPSLKSKTEIKTLLCMVKHLSIYASKFAEITSFLRYV